MKKDYSTLIWGIVILVAGISFTGNTLGLWNVDVFFDGWWTLFIIIPGIASILSSGFSWWSSFLVLFGGALLLDSQDILNVSDFWGIILPVALIIFGFSIIISFFKKDKFYYGMKSDKIKYDTQSYPKYSAIFGGGEVKNNSSNLKAVKINVLFGGFDLDLRDANINEDIIIDANVMFGGIDVYVPPNVEVEIIYGTPIFGGFSSRENRITNGVSKVRVKYFTLFGGIDIK